MKDEGDVARTFAHGALDTTHGGLVNLTELRRAAEPLVHDLDARFRAAAKPLHVRRDVPFVVIRQQEGLVERDERRVLAQ